MARPAAHAKTHNGFDPDKVQSFVTRIENLVADIASMRGKFMAEVKEVRGDITAVYEDAKETGIPLKELRKVIRTRGLAQKIQTLRDSLNEDEVDNYDNLIQALGGLSDLPLGQAALDKAEKTRRGPGRPKKSDGEAVETDTGDAFH